MSITTPSPASPRLPFLLQQQQHGGGGQEAVRVSASRAGSDEQQTRRFSVDPSLTDLTVLRNLLRRAFEMRGDFSLSYRVLDDYGAEAWLPMVSDWDLSAAFLSAAEPDLQLLVRQSQTGSRVGNEDWDLIESEEVAQPIPNHYRSTSQRGQQNGVAVTRQVGGGPPISPSATPGPGLFNTFNSLLRRAISTLSDISVTTHRPPLTDSEFRTFLDPGRGVLLKPTELRFACYHGGVEPSLRRVVWKHLLNLYPPGMSGTERIGYVRDKCREYEEMRAVWGKEVGHPSPHLSTITNMVRKDVLRTDRHLPYYAGEGNENVGRLFNILTTYALNHPSVGYCQGMSDLASPLLLVMGEEPQAYLCFCCLMERVGRNFNQDGVAMEEKFSHLSLALAHYDAYYWAYLKSIGADDLLFTYRWLLLELRREFAFEESLRMMEVLWASVGARAGGVRLWEVKYSPSSATTSSSAPIPVPPISSYTKVAAIRRSSTQELRRRRSKQKSGGRSLEERGVKEPSRSLADSIEVLSLEELGSSPFEVLEVPTPRLVKNLGEFYAIGGGKEVEEDDVFKEQEEVKDRPPPTAPEEAPPSDYGESDSGHCSASVEESLESPATSKLPPPSELGGGNPFLIFLSLTLLLQHRDVIIRNRYDYNETAMHFDKLVRRQNLNRVLTAARQMYDEYERGRVAGGGRGQQERC